MSVTGIAAAAAHRRLEPRGSHEAGDQRHQRQRTDGGHECTGGQGDQDEEPDRRLAAG